VAQKRHLGTDGSTSSASVVADDVYEDSEDESEMTVRTKAARYIRQGLYYITDSEKFRPPRKRPKYVLSLFFFVPFVSCESSVKWI